MRLGDLNNSLSNGCLHLKISGNNMGSREYVLPTHIPSSFPKSFFYKNWGGGGGGGGGNFPIVSVYITTFYVYSFVLRMVMAILVQVVGGGG